MINSFAKMQRRLRQHAMPSQFIARGIVPEKSRPHHAAIFGEFCGALEPVEACKRLLFRNRASGLSCTPSIRFPPHHAGDISMTITAAHISAIVALIAGVLILIMPRLPEFHRRDLPDLRRSGRPRRVQDGFKLLARESGVSRLARNPSKWCKARISSPSFGLLHAMAKAVAKSRSSEICSEIKAIRRPGQGRAAACRPQGAEEEPGQAGAEGQKPAKAAASKPRPRR